VTTTHDVINPADEQVVATVEAYDEAATDAAIARARAAFPAWRDVAPGDRAGLLRRFAAAVDGDLEHLAQLEVRNAGHTVSNARWEAGNARDVIGFYAGSPERLSGQQIPVSGGVDITFHEPLGVVGVIVPWNFPMPIASWGLAPALAAGNTVVLKPAELTPLTAMRLAELALDAGLPEGVFQVLPGPGRVVGQRFVDHPDVAKVVFTGSTEVGRAVMRGVRRSDQAGHARARRQERQRRVRRCRPRGGRGDRAVRRLRQRRPGLLRAVADPGAAQCVGGVHGAVRAGREARRRRRPA
jgi:acyl-CoA reductase-like NAD-dependent aldehyde dehydrogenase